MSLLTLIMGKAASGGGPPPGTQPTIVAGTFTEDATQTTVVVDKPAGTTTGDVTYIAISTEAEPSIVCSTRPSGFLDLTGADTNQPAASTTGDVSMRLFIYRKTIGASEPSSWSFTFSTSTWSSDAAITVRNDGGVDSVIALGPGLGGGSPRLSAITLSATQVAIGFGVGYFSGTAESVSGWSEASGSTRFGFYTTTTQASDAALSPSDGASWASVTVRINGV